MGTLEISPMVRLPFFLIAAALFSGGLTSPARAAMEPSTELRVAMSRLLDISRSAQVRGCQKQWFFVRKVTNVCTRTLDRLVEPVKTADESLKGDIAVLQKKVCPSLFDYGCSPAEIRFRNAAYLLEEAERNLRRAAELELTDYRSPPLWDRILVKDNRLGVIFAVDFVDEALVAYDGFLKL